MRKNMFFLPVLLLLFMLAPSCSKTGTPTAPGGVTASPTGQPETEETPKPTETLTPTGTLTQTISYTTAINTGTITPSHSCTVTSTQTLSNTPTDTYTQSATPTVSDTHTFTTTPTDTATITQTATITETLTQTMTPTITDTPAVTLTVEAVRTVIAGMAYTGLSAVPGGTFTQSDGLNSFTHTVTGFKCGKYEVTYELWHTVYEWATGNGFIFSNEGMEGSEGTRGAEPTAAKYEPVTNIDWRDAIVWCNSYSIIMGLTPVYYSDAGMTLPILKSYTGNYLGSGDLTPGSFDNPYVNWSANGYRLLTEGEWQYAASYVDGTSWTPSNYASGASASFYTVAASEAVAWFMTNSGDVTHEAGGRSPNALGIYDMNGNVDEWCWDLYGAYPAAPSADYRGPASGSDRIVRGAAYNAPAVGATVGSRGQWKSYSEYPEVGLRIGKNQ